MFGGCVPEVKYLSRQSVLKLPGDPGQLVWVSIGGSWVEEDGHQQEDQGDLSGFCQRVSFIFKGLEECGVTFHFLWAFFVPPEWHNARGYSAPKVQCCQPSGQ